MAMIAPMLDLYVTGQLRSTNYIKIINLYGDFFIMFYEMDIFLPSTKTLKLYKVNNE